MKVATLDEFTHTFLETLANLGAFRLNFHCPSGRRSQVKWDPTAPIHSRSSAFYWTGHTDIYQQSSAKQRHNGLSGRSLHGEPKSHERREPERTGTLVPDLPRHSRQRTFAFARRKATKSCALFKNHNLDRIYPVVDLYHHTTTIWKPGIESTGSRIQNKSSAKKK